jgi:hypothetical protein
MHILLTSARKTYRLSVLVLWIRLPLPSSETHDLWVPLCSGWNRLLTLTESSRKLFFVAWKAGRFEWGLIRWQGLGMQGRDGRLD